jgi:hypothetical protein
MSNGEGRGNWRLKSDGRVAGRRHFVLSVLVRLRMCSRLRPFVLFECDGGGQSGNEEQQRKRERESAIKRTID